jgi:hypothetical protein
LEVDFMRAFSPHNRRVPLECEALEERLVLDNNSYVQNLYLDVLHRSGDTAGINFWVGRLNNNTSRFQLAQFFWTSTEHRGVEVDFYYTHFLHRNADGGGRALWIQKLQSGQGEFSVIINFLTSTEYINQHNTQVAFVDAVYADVLNRIPNSSEEAFWIGILNRAGTFGVASGIQNSKESVLDMIDAYYEGITSTPTGYLGRAPDANGENFWLSQIQTGKGNPESVAEGILASDEYFNFKVKSGPLGQPPV